MFKFWKIWSLCSSRCKNLSLSYNKILNCHHSCKIFNICITNSVAALFHWNVTLTNKYHGNWDTLRSKNVPYCFFTRQNVTGSWFGLSNEKLCILAAQGVAKLLEVKVGVPNSIPWPGCYTSIYLDVVIITAWAWNCFGTTDSGAKTMRNISFEDS